MSKVVQFINKAKSGRGNKSRGAKPRSSIENDTRGEQQSTSSASPRSVAGNSVEDLFNIHRKSAFEQEPITVPITADGKIQGTKPVDEDGKEKSVTSQEYDVDISDGPSEGDYEDIGYDSSFHDFHQMSNAKRAHSSSEYLYDFTNHSDNRRELRKTDRNQERNNLRSQSVQRPMQEINRGISLIEPKLDSKNRRSKSTGRSERRAQITSVTLNNYEPTPPTSNMSAAESSPKRKSKMEKILQLQEKNERYKEEFRKVQKDRKSLKKQVESKKLETAALTKEIDTHIAATSILKLKLSEALQQLDRTDLDERKDKSAINKLKKELLSVRGDYNAAVSRVARMREEVESMKVSVGRKDEQIETLTKEITEQATLVDSLHMEIDALKTQDAKSVANSENLKELKVENERLQEEFGKTLQRASSMVKEREEAIADLLKENEEMKRLIARREEVDDNQIANEEFVQLRTELNVAVSALEESQDRNVLLEEELEAWIAKGDEMETEIHRLRDDVEAWQRKATAAEKTVLVVEASALQSAKKANSAEAALAEAERKYKDYLQEQERRHTEALLDQKEKMAQQLAEAKEAAVPSNPQEMMLQKAVADRKAKDAAKGGSWGSVIQRVRTAASIDQDEELSAEQMRIRELEICNAENEDEIAKVKSEMVRLRSTYNDTMYTSKKRIEQLENANMEYAAKQQAMELELASLRQSQDSYPNPCESSVCSF